MNIYPNIRCVYCFGQCYRDEDNDLVCLLCTRTQKGVSVRAHQTPKEKPGTFRTAAV